MWSAEEIARLRAQLKELNSAVRAVPAAWGRGVSLGRNVRKAFAAKGMKFLNPAKPNPKNFVAQVQKIADEAHSLPFAPERFDDWLTQRPVVYHGTSWVQYALMNAGWVYNFREVVSERPEDSEPSAYTGFMVAYEIDEALRFVADDLPEEFLEVLGTDFDRNYPKVGVVLAVRTSDYRRIWDAVRHVAPADLTAPIVQSGSAVLATPPAAPFLQPVALI